MSDAREKAKRLFSHYVTLIMREMDLKVDSDTSIELDECIDAIIDAAVEETLRQIDSREHHDR